MSSTIRDMFPFGDVDDSVVEMATQQFGDVPAEALGSVFALGKAVVEMLETIPKPLAEHGISPGRWRLLIALLFQSDEDGATMGALADHLQVAEPTVTATVQRLENEGLVERSRDPNDKRRVLVRVTPAGVQKAAQVIPSLAPRLERFVATLGGPEATRDMANRLTEATQQLDP